MVANKDQTISLDFDLGVNYQGVSEGYQKRADEFEQKSVFIMSGICGGALVLLTPLYFNAPESSPRIALLVAIVFICIAFICSLFSMNSFTACMIERAKEFRAKGNKEALKKAVVLAISQIEDMENEISANSISSLYGQIDLM